MAARMLLLFVSCALLASARAVDHHVPCTPLTEQFPAIARKALDEFKKIGKGDIDNNCGFLPLPDRPKLATKLVEQGIKLSFVFIQTTF